jgi:hypothetical protein
VNNTTYDYMVRALDAGLLYADSAEVEVTPTVPNPPQNQPPVVQDDAIIASADTAITINVLTNDFDPDDDPLRVRIVAEPGHGTATLNDSYQTIRYEPVSGFSGTDSLTYEVSDARGGTATAKVTLTIVATPVLVSITESPEVSGDFTVVWQVAAGRTYRLQFKNDLRDATWTDLSEDVTAGSAILEFSHSAGSLRQGLYRVLEAIAP